jgi:hypothetical protein
MRANGEPRPVELFKEKNESQEKVEYVGRNLCSFIASNPFMYSGRAHFL